MIAQWLVTGSAGVALLLGVLHLYFTYVGDKLHPRDQALLAQMKQTRLVIAQQHLERVDRF